MYVDLKQLKPNPLRDFTIDPIDEDRVAALKASIKEDGFWGGVVCRRLPNGTIQIAAGHHRVDAARAAGIKEADVFVSDDLDDAGMVRIYARENATQRGNTDSALAGAVAAAIKVVAKMVMTGHFPGIPGMSIKAADSLRGVLESSRGLGEDVIGRFLEKVPEISSDAIKTQLAALKASHEYARIIGEVRDQIEAENREALKALAKAEKEQQEAEERSRKAEATRKEAAAVAKVAKEEAAQKAADLAHQKAVAEAALAERRRKEAEAEMAKFDALRKTRDTATKASAAADERPETFDRAGVSKVLTTPAHVDAFRRVVTGQGVAPYLPVAGQVAMAKHVVAKARTIAADAEKRGVSIREPLTADFIHQTVMEEAFHPKQYQRKIGKEEQTARETAAATEKVKRLLVDFERACSSLWKSGTELHEYINGSKWPKGAALPLSGRFHDLVKAARDVLTKLERKL